MSGGVDALPSFERDRANVRIWTVSKREECRKRRFGVRTNIGK
jgi:hypothetical protein